MDKITQYREAYRKAVELHTLGNYAEASAYARQALRLEQEIGADAQMTASEPMAQSLLALIERDLRTASMAVSGDIAKLMQDLGTDDWPEAIEALKKVGEPAVLPLCRVVTDGSADVKRRGLAASALAEIAGPRSIDAILELLQDSRLRSDKYATRNAIFALKQFKDDRIGDGVKHFLRDQDQGIREAATIVLESHGRDSVRPSSAEQAQESAQQGIRKKWWQFRKP